MRLEKVFVLKCLLECHIAHRNVITVGRAVWFSVLYLLEFSLHCLVYFPCAGA